jgi:hypothetical protein
MVTAVMAITDEVVITDDVVDVLASEVDTPMSKVHAVVSAALTLFDLPEELLAHIVTMNGRQAFFRWRLVCKRFAQSFPVPLQVRVRHWNIGGDDSDDSYNSDDSNNSYGVDAVLTTLAQLAHIGPTLADLRAAESLARKVVSPYTNFNMGDMPRAWFRRLRDVLRDVDIFHLRYMTRRIWRKRDKVGVHNKPSASVPGHCPVCCTDTTFRIGCRFQTMSDYGCYPAAVTGVWRCGKCRTRFPVYKL